MKRKKRPHSKPKKYIKRILDLLICLGGMPVILPIGVILAIFIFLDSRGPIIYCQERIGRDGKPFRLYKFRTMVKDADKLLDVYLKTDPQFADEWAGKQKLCKDPRLTRSGNFLRKTSLDELPQFLNILLGNMTLVGPRPIVSSETHKYGRFFKEYCEVQPGLTGLWQVSGRNNTTYSRRVACDHFYINNWSVALDIWIILRTFPTAFSGNGAY